MCQGETSGNAERQPGPAPAAKAPPPHRPGRQGVRRQQSLLSWVSQSPARGCGWQEQTPLQAPLPSFPGTPLSASALDWSLGSGIPGSSASSEPSEKKASGEGQPPAPPRQGFTPHAPLATGASPSHSSAPPRCRSAFFCGQDSEGGGCGQGWLRDDPALLFPTSSLRSPTYSSCIPISSRALLKDSTSPCSFITSSLSLLLFGGFCGPSEWRVSVS